MVEIQRAPGRVTEPCCPPSLCDFRPERIRFWLYHLKMARWSRYDPVESAQSYAHSRGERHMGRSAWIGYSGSDDAVEVSAIMDSQGWWWKDGRGNYSLQDVIKLTRDIDKLAKVMCPFAVECKKG
jgi:hypothetical protein